ncbi:MAG: DEAD/DEAH box helicase family protein, partial [Thermoleophilia bacterium]|nr:DEAD/DEAH box helicase family protein [Thermoleophilia bacterium]
MSIARVEPLTTARALRGPFDYSIPERLAEIEVGNVLQVPFGPRRLLGVVVELTETSEVPAERLAEPIRILGSGTTPELVDLGIWIAREYCSTPARGLGLMLPPGTGTGGERTRARVEKLNRLTDAGREAISGGDRLGAKQKLVLTSLLEGEMTGRELSARTGADGAALKRLESRGLIAREEIRVRRRPEGSVVGSAAADAPELTSEQSAAVSDLAARLDSETMAEALLAGVTGSGKTEVYLALVEQVIAKRTAEAKANYVQVSNLAARVIQSVKAMAGTLEMTVRGEALRHLAQGKQSTSELLSDIRLESMQVVRSASEQSRETLQMVKTEAVTQLAEARRDVPSFWRQITLGARHAIRTASAEGDALIGGVLERAQRNAAHAKQATEDALVGV